MTLCLAWASQGQDWNRVPGGDVITGTNWFGARPGSTIPLRIETRVNQPIQLYTNSVKRLRLNPTQTYATLNGYPNVNADGNVLISPNDNFINSTVGPFTRLHLADGVSGGNNSALGFRPKPHVWIPDNGGPLRRIVPKAPFQEVHEM